MSNPTTRRFCIFGAALICASAAHARTELISNGGFESGFSGWVRSQQLGSDGSFLDQAGTTSPVNAFAVPAPPQGLHAAMTDGQGPGTHLLYQDFVVPASVPLATIQFSLFVNNSAAAFSTPATLDFATPTLNQQARVDILTTGADPFSTGAADILQNLFQTAVGSPLVSGYSGFNVDITALLSAHAGETLRLRFADADNVNFFNFGVDSVSVNVVPAPSVGWLALPVVLLRGRRRR
jgi:hypothetical protein